MPKLNPWKRSVVEKKVDIALIREKASFLLARESFKGKTWGEWKRNVEGNGTSTLCRIIDVKTSGMSEVKPKEDRTEGEN